MTLDETVGTLKVQLAPRTDFWPNVSAAVNVVTAVKDLLKPTPKKTILEIGCGIGVIGLMLASVSTRITLYKIYTHTKIILRELNRTIDVLSSLMIQYTRNLQ